MAASASTSIDCEVRYLKPPGTHPGHVRSANVRKAPYIAFIDIPYAKPPKGPERCQPPKSLSPTKTCSTETCSTETCSTETADPSTSTGETNVTEKTCIQPNVGTSLYIGSEDCLYLNIYLPERPEKIKQLLPVLVHIHGGGFRYGSKSEMILSPDLIVHHGVVFVTVNYRLGVLGFGNMGTKECPGNAGLKDQVKALEWIQDNIVCFKGDPTNVTISGQSAGATCVNHHLVSPQSKHLFHKAIVQSGGFYCPWGFRGRQHERRQMLSRDEKFNQMLRSKEQSVELHQHSAHLLSVDRQARHPRSISPSFGPTVEKNKEEAFIPFDVERMMENVIDFDKPVMAGITKEEGISLFLDPKGRKLFVDMMVDDEVFRKFLMDNLRWSEQTAQGCFGEIKRKYFPQRLRTSPKTRDQCVQNFFRDILFRRFYDNFKFGPEKTLPKKLYVYRFDHVSEISDVKLFPKELASFNDATHGDELTYLFCPETVKEDMRKFIYEGPNQNPEIRQVMDHLCSLWANFCKDGVPKSDYDSDKTNWRCHSDDDPCFLSISKNLRLIEESLFEDEWGWFNALVSTKPILPSPDTPVGQANVPSRPT